MGRHPLTTEEIAAELARDPRSPYGRRLPLVREVGCLRDGFVRSAIWAVIMLLMLAFGAGDYGAQVVKVEEVRRTARAAHLLDDAVAAIAAYSFDKVATLDGLALHERVTLEASDFHVRLAVTNAAADLLKVRGVLWDNRSRQALSEFVTYRRKT